MNQYLLLRDNKQTGPYTAQELAAKGLKPYDLVWLEGKSAAWRYPGELDELKAFAPGVEEQPYDRFYKKTGEETTRQQAVAETNTVQESQPVNKQVELTSKHIYVTMPVGKAQTATTPVAKKEEKAVSQQNDKNVNSANNTQKKAASTYLISEEDDEMNSALLKGHNSRKLEDDEINNGFISEYESRKAAWSKNTSGGSTIKEKEKPVEKVAALPQKETWASPKKEPFDLKALLAGSGQYLQNNKNLTRVLVAAVLILGGVVIGLVINSGHKQPDTQALESLVKEIRDKQNEKASTTAPPPTTEVAQKTTTPRRSSERSYYNETDNLNTDPAPPANSTPNNNPANQAGSRHAVIKKENSVVIPPPGQTKSIAVPISNTNSQPVETSPAVMEPREKPIDKEVIEKARKNIYEQVHVEASAFKVGLLGGISDLDITVQNTSSYALDQVAVEIKYFGPEKKLVKSQTLLFNNVPAGKRRTLEAPSTRRGITIDYTITSINSKTLGLAQSGF
ncbi:hypothetical protein A4D02_22320 [Niastella koreensis]|uniref:GYF domain-containing protein n=2 Tax=Niastella koreensis TaxID=354356 RepID=G8TFI3_NIAKG|nr:DUF4339 domain-containing protein [Niastella koreensis]AEV98414.1 hypothetical protein Niako_2059 [Niastella koreensis GR20-10]OQP53136.1 hypothetical protein A4D02_22320 [Niastella koreensis]